ncbi:hypothetical protein RRG08_014306 [Elysia crispata]|uniref:Uncharacterized protein n=1 Tax=Elysia crispata TaxID=231223 RepID=A0AAE1D942_9GAST|nr:hypothetical protein RRG08_014306 [Elysia crispata]
MRPSSGRVKARLHAQCQRQKEDKNEEEEDEKNEEEEEDKNKEEKDEKNKEEEEDKNEEEEEDKNEKEEGGRRRGKKEEGEKIEDIVVNELAGAKRRHPPASKQYQHSHCATDKSLATDGKRRRARPPFTGFKFSGWEGE